MTCRRHTPVFGVLVVAMLAVAPRAQADATFKCGIVSINDVQHEYAKQFAPLLSAASRVRSLLSLNGLTQGAAFELLRLPGLLPFIIRKTRRA